VPRVEFTFVGDVPWALVRFREMEMIDDETQMSLGGEVTVSKRAFEHKIGSERGVKTFKAVVKCLKFNEPDKDDDDGELVRHIRFLFD